MTKRNAIPVSIVFHSVLLTALAIYLTFKEKPIVEAEREATVVAVDTFLVQPKEDPPPEAEERDRIEIRDPLEAEQHSTVDPIDVPPSDQQAAFNGAVGDTFTTDGPSPKAIAKPSPDFPGKARRDNVSGQVEAILTIGPDGRVSDVEIVSATPEGYFEKATLKALRKWRYERQLATPASTSAQRKVKVTIDFDLKD